MVKRKDTEHAKIRKYLEKRFKDIAKNMDYGPHIGCTEGGEKSDEKEDGVRRQIKGRRTR